MLFPTLGPSSLPVVVSRLTKVMSTEQLLFWSGMTDTDHGTTSGLNDEADHGTTSGSNDEELILHH